MKTNFKEVQGHFEDAKFTDDIILKLSDARLGKKCQLFEKIKHGSISPISDCYTFGEMVAFITGLRKYESLKNKLIHSQVNTARQGKLTNLSK